MVHLRSWVICTAVFLKVYPLPFHFTWSIVFNNYRKQLVLTLLPVTLGWEARCYITSTCKRLSIDRRALSSCFLCFFWASLYVFGAIPAKPSFQPLLVVLHSRSRCQVTCQGVLQVLSDTNSSTTGCTCWLRICTSTVHQILPQLQKKFAIESDQKLSEVVYT